MSHYRSVFCRAADYPPLADDLHRFRKKVFVDEHGWDLPNDGDRETDAFDTGSAIYCATFYGARLVGMFRAIRCDSPYLGVTVFPELAIYRDYPLTADSWEISRFGMSREGCFEHARVNYALMLRFARQMQVRSLVAVADLTYERFLRGLGIRTTRYGPPTLIGKHRSGKPLFGIAGEICMAEQSGLRFQRLIELGLATEIEDASHVFGYRRISA